MPYATASGGWERADRLGHVNTILESQLADEWGSFHLPAIEPDLSWLDGKLEAVDALDQQADPAVVAAIAVDGSQMEVPARERYPSVRVGYFQVGSVYVNLERMSVPAHEFVDPALIARSTSRGLLNATVPSTNVYFREGLDVRESWRARIADLFSRKGLSADGQRTVTLQDLLFLLHGTPATPASTIEVSACPYRVDDGCLGANIAVPPEGSTCPQCGRGVFPTDVLRIAEEVSDDSPNGAALGRLAMAVELLVFLGQLTEVYRQAPQVLGKLAFINDGPLATFGTVAKLKTQVLRYLEAAFDDLRARQLPLPVILGIEKSGRFVDHALAIGDHVPAGHLVLLDAEYLGRILGSQQRGARYGHDEYWGRRFILKTTDERVLVLTVPPGDGGVPYGDDAALAGDLDRYPTLLRACRLLDRIGTALYANAVIPVALAHNYVAYPVGIGSDVLRLFAQQQLGLPSEVGRVRQLYP